MRRLLLGLVLAVCTVAPADAHRLKVFATVEDGILSGYGFFIGGGRPQGADVIIRDGAGRDLFRSHTGDQGEFSWQPPAPGDFTVVVDARDGHVAETRIGAERFSGAVVATPSTVTEAAPAAIAAQASAVGCADLDRAVDRAVARQIRPLLEAYDQAEGRTRFNDVVGGIGMIVGLAGVALWARGRRRPPER